VHYKSIIFGGSIIITIIIISLYSFSSSPMEALMTGKLLNSRQMQGNEQLLLNYTSALGTGVVIEVFGFITIIRIRIIRQHSPHHSIPYKYINSHYS
jgi:hypothetical protein